MFIFRIINNALRVRYLNIYLICQVTCLCVCVLNLIARHSCKMQLQSPIVIILEYFKIINLILVSSIYLNFIFVVSVTNNLYFLLLNSIVFYTFCLQLYKIEVSWVSMFDWFILSLQMLIVCRLRVLLYSIISYS